MNRFTVLATLLFAGIVVTGCGTDRGAATDVLEYERSLAQWHAEREARLKGPDGWLNLAGLHWLHPGSNSVGSSPDNDIVLAQGSAAQRLGAFLLEDGEVTFQAESGAEVFSSGEPVTRLPLVHDEAGEPTLLTHRTLGWYAIRRLERMGVRLRDYDHPALGAFPGIESYPAELNWWVEARFNAYPEPRQLHVMTVVEGLGWDPIAPGILEFEVNGDRLSLEAYGSGDGFFVIFADQTTGNATYPAGRYLNADAPDSDGITILDFNKAYNPPCAFNEFATCPLPTRRNFLGVAVEAGEKYHEGLHAAGI